MKYWKRELGKKHAMLTGTSVEECKEIVLQFCRQLPFYGFHVFFVNYCPLSSYSPRSANINNNNNNNSNYNNTISIPNNVVTHHNSNSVSNNGNQDWNLPDQLFIAINLNGLFLLSDKNEEIFYSFAYLELLRQRSTPTALILTFEGVDDLVLHTDKVST